MDDDKTKWAKMVTCLHFGPSFLLNSIKYAAATHVFIERHQPDFTLTLLLKKLSASIIPL